MTGPEGRLEQAHPSILPVLAPIAALLLVILTVASGAGPSTVWYVIRASGMIAFVLLTLSVVAGLLISDRRLPSGRPRVDLYEVHTFVSLLALGFTSVHGLALLLDRSVGFSAVQIAVPFTSSYRPLAVGLGIIAFYVAALVYGSFYLRSRIGYRRWRALHYASFGAFFLASAHGIFSGTDTHTWWAAAIYLVVTLAVVGLTWLRVGGGRAAAAGHLASAGH